MFLQIQFITQIHYIINQSPPTFRRPCEQNSTQYRKKTQNYFICFQGFPVINNISFEHINGLMSIISIKLLLTMTSRNQEGSRRGRQSQGARVPEQAPGARQNQQNAQFQTISASTGIRGTLRGGVEQELFDVVGDNMAVLTWSNGEGDVIFRGPSDFTILRSFKNSLLALRNDFGLDGQGRIIIEGQNVDSYKKRLLLLQSQIQGLLKRRINFSLKDEKGERVLDYTNLLNEKENQIIQLEKKIQNYEQRLRRTSARQQELENQITNLRLNPIKNEDLIRARNDIILAQVAYSNQLKESLLRIKRNFQSNRAKFPNDAERLLFDGVIWPADEDIKAESLTKTGAKGRGNLNVSNKTRTQMIALFRQFERLLANPNVTQVEFDNALEGAILGLEGSTLRETIQQRISRGRLEEQFNNLRAQFSTAASLFRTQLDKLHLQYPSARFDFDVTLSSLLSSNNIQITNINGVTQVERFTQKTIQVPVQDSKTKHLIHLLSVQMKKFVQKYPKLREEVDTRLYQFFQQELIDVIEVDQLDRVVSIVKYVPQVVKVQNVYAYSSQSSRRVEFHLRVLVKALLQELQKLKLRTGAVLEIDEGIIGMINEEIMGVVDVDDILKVFRVVPKIVEVEKIIQKVVDRIVQVPQVVPIQKIVEKVIEVPKIQEVQKIIHVPVEIIKYVDNVVEKIVQVERIVEKVVEVPRIIEKVVERVIEIPKVQEVVNIVEKIVERQVPYEVQKIVNHTIPQIKEIQIIKEKVIPVERIVQRIVEVPTIVEKIVEKVVQVPQIIEIERFVEKIVNKIQYRNAREVVNHVETVHQVVDRIVERAIPVIQTIEKVVEVPQIIEKVVTVQVQVPTVHEITVIEEKIVYVDRIKQVERVVNQVVPLIKEVEKIIDRRVEVPVIQEKIVKVPEIITQIVVQKTEIPRIIEVERQVDKIVEVTKLLQVQKPVNHYIRENQIQKVVVEKIVQVPRTVQRLKQVRVNIDKIIEKMVQVPKVVEVEKIVEKIVVVPRVIQKVVEVPQIVEKLVDRLVEVERIREVQVTVQVPVITEKIVEVEVVKNIYHQVEKVVEKIIEKVIPVEKVVETVNIIENSVQKVIEVKVQVPKEIEVEKVVTTLIEVEKVIQLEKPTTISVQIPVPVDRIVEKVIQVRSEVEKIVQVPQIVEKIIQVKVEEVRIEEVQRLVQKVVIDQRIKEVVKEVPYLQETIVEVPTTTQKIVPVQSVVSEIQQVASVVQKVVTLTNEIPKVYEIQRLVEKVVQIPQIVQLEVVTPMIVKVNQIIEAIRQKTVEIPVIHQEIVEVPTIEEKIVAVKLGDTEIRQVVVNRDKIVEVDRYIEKTNTVNYVQDNIQIVDRYEERAVPVFSTVEKIIEVPHILEKIVEKIVIMPQVVEVIKYVHQIVEEATPGVAVGIDVSIQEARYRELYGGIRGRFDIILTELRKLKAKHPQLKIQIETLEKFLIEFNKLAEFQRIVQVDRERIVEHEKPYPILVPTRDSQSLRVELSQALLIEKLIVELRRLKTENPKIRLALDQDVNLLFFPEFQGQVALAEDIQSLLNSYTDTVIRKFTSIDGSWTTDHELILSTVLSERFALANLIKEANLSIERANSIAQQRLQGLRKYKLLNSQLIDNYNSIRQQVSGFVEVTQGDTRFANEVSRVTSLVNNLQGLVTTDLKTIKYQEETVAVLSEIHGESTDFVRLESLLRERLAENDLLRNRMIEIEKGRPIGTSVSTVSISSDQTKTIQNLRNQITTLNNQLSQLRRQSQVNVNISANTSEYEIKIRTLNSRIQQLESQLRTVRIDYEGQLRTSKTQADKSLRESQLRINDLERKIANYERQIESLNRRLQDAAHNIKLTPGTPNTRIEGSIVSSGVGPRQDSNTPLSESRNSSESGTARSGTYTPGQYTYGTNRGSAVGLQGTGGLGVSLNIPQTGRVEGATMGQSGVIGESGTASYNYSESGSVGGVSGSGSRTSGAGFGATYTLGGSGSRASGVTGQISGVSGIGNVQGSSLSGSGSVTGSEGRSGSGTYTPGQYSNYRRTGGDKQ